MELPNRFYSNPFLVLKEGSDQRLVINLKALYEFIQTQHFKMEGILTLKELVRPGDWLAKVDLNSAHRMFLSFFFNCLPFEFHGSLPRP